MTLALALTLSLASGIASARPRVVAALREPVVALNPFAPATIEGYRLNGLIFEPLARVDPRTNALIPWLALKWTRLPGGRGVRVELRPGVTFHDGRALTAEDIKSTLDAFRDPAHHAATWTPLWADVTAVRVISPLTLEFETRSLTYETLRNVLTNLRVLPRHRPAADLVGSGPFRKPVVGGGRVDFEPNETWWQAAPAFDVRFRAVADAGLARDLLKRGELDVYNLGADGDDATPAGPGEGAWLDLNLRRPLFASVESRRALLMLWNRAELNQKIFGGRRALALDTFAPPRPGAPVAYDPAAAHAILKTLGWRERDGRLERHGRAFEFEILVGQAEQERWVSLLRESLSKAGIMVTIKRVALDGEWWRRLREGDFDAAVGSGPPSLVVNADAWHSRGAYNVVGLRDAKLDRTLDRLNREFDPARRWALEREAQLRVRALMPQLPGVVAPRGAYLRSARLRFDDVAPDDVWRWRLR